MSTTTFQDKYGDDFEIEPDEGDVIVTTYGDDGSFASSAFTKDEARKVAVAIFQAAGGGPEGPVLASTISFNEGVIRLAAVHGKTVEFRYVKSDNDAPATRRLVPESYLAKNGGSFLGPDPDRDGELRRYRLDRIKGTVGVVA